MLRHSAVGQEVFLDVVAIRLEQHIGAAQITDLLVRALDHAVALAGLGIDDFALSGHFEPLFSGRFGLHLGHFALHPAKNFTDLIKGDVLPRRSSRYERK